MQSIEIQMLPFNASANLVDMEHVTDIVNRVYAASEGSLWMRGVVRTTKEEMAGFTREGEIAVARSMGQILGCVRVRRIGQETGEFGMLAVDDGYQGTGIGRRLVRFAEEKCQKEHLHKMQLELLIPLKGSHPAKLILRNWYERIGYHPIHMEPIDAAFPKLTKMLAIPRQFVVFQKELR
ncbi:GNAT family N-acetyltransferase [Virgibacillus phasianinus]|uniref:GNAT family N-acetyltransferase n=1 Tax=Virgibacillus phasianinus TaxID=2017483 RepID=A0A220U2T6_9BACI|nr:GNAT family N-acetyltransferase [Virgibacillus phasianinus]ASK62397.1 GNAT family N-acetyltransferase [Virgibacillus phasianinus]